MWVCNTRYGSLLCYNLEAGSKLQAINMKLKAQTTGRLLADSVVKDECNTGVTSIPSSSSFSAKRRIVKQDGLSSWKAVNSERRTCIRVQLPVEVPGGAIISRQTTSSFKLEIIQAHHELLADVSLPFNTWILLSQVFKRSHTRTWKIQGGVIPVLQDEYTIDQYKVDTRLPLFFRHSNFRHA
ncbi:hypothetical protein IW261DRAFT_1420296 [Armillaria novae-zelandiae]|uniref:Uncharacterized protein n=1 Tax=Armillaria novae-zelandiae TaxID=153914 RepID=A0AA39UE65_9AGAR|nr:hypothetical protein IW261DRAFT_1420296 [Armillaria novae-zelandiae]